MASRADGLVQRGLFVDPARGDPRDDPRQSKMFCLEAPRRHAVEPLYPRRHIETSDNGETIIGGNQRVIAARLSDAKFFYETDLKTKLEDRLPKLDKIVFHEKLGTQGERVQRIAALAKELAPLVGADAGMAERAANLAKADLVTEMVGEFPELQGLMAAITRPRRANMAPSRRPARSITSRKDERPRAVGPGVDRRGAGR